jgi:predicted RNA-binding Zn ribbon-like protein
MVETEEQTPIFEFTGNWLCLDFANTMSDRPSDSPQELLKSYNDLVSWAAQAHIVTENEAERLRNEAVSRPAEASAVLKRAIDLREAIYRIFSALGNDSSAEEADLVILNGALSEGMAQAHIVPKANGFSWDWSGKEDALERILWLVVRSAADLLVSEELDTVRVCASEDCQWLFLDTSKNKSRRWCDMKSCGNRAKARRHYQRKK